jgi:hypothetical protein
MSKTDYVIQLKKGLNDVPFGATAEEAHKYFGDPTEIEILEKDLEEDPDTELWYFDDQSFSLFFEGDPDLVLTSIEINNQDATLFGKKIFGMSEDQIIELMKDNGFSEMYTEDEEWGEKLLSFEDALIDFYFEENKLVTANWSIDSPEE